MSLPPVLQLPSVFSTGHSDVVMGALITNDNSLAEQIKFIQFGKCTATETYTLVHTRFCIDQLYCLTQKQDCPKQPPDRNAQTMYKSDVLSGIMRFS